MFWKKMLVFAWLEFDLSQNLVFTMAGLGRDQTELLKSLGDGEEKEDWWRLDQVRRTT
jgi:hypothetical protein